jgi:hypothetical protein
MAYARRQWEDRLGAPPVEPNCLRVNRVDPEVRLAPRIPLEGRPDGIRGLGHDGEHHAVLVGERPAHDDETRIDEPVHEGRVRWPVRLPFIGRVVSH